MEQITRPDKKAKIEDFIKDLNRVSIDQRALPDKVKQGKFSVVFTEEAESLKVEVFYSNLESPDDKLEVMTMSCECKDLSPQDVEDKKYQSLTLFYMQFFRAAFVQEDAEDKPSISTLLKKGLA